MKMIKLIVFDVQLEKVYIKEIPEQIEDIDEYLESNIPGSSGEFTYIQVHDSFHPLDIVDCIG